MQKRRVLKSNTFFQTACLLLLLVVFTSCLIPSLYARYTSSAGGEDGARVAKYAFEVSDGAGGDFVLGELPAKPGESKTYTFSVTNKSSGGVSEVAQKYTVTASDFGNLPFTYTFKQGETVVGNGTFEGSFAAGEEGVYTYTLVIEWPNTSPANGAEYAGLAERVTVTIDSEQID